MNVEPWLSAIAKEPENFGYYLAFADALEEAGDQERSQMIRRAAEIAPLVDRHQFLRGQTTYPPAALVLRKNVLALFNRCYCGNCAGAGVRLLYGDNHLLDGIGVVQPCQQCKGTGLFLPPREGG